MYACVCMYRKRKIILSGPEAQKRLREGTVHILTTCTYTHYMYIYSLHVHILTTCTYTHYMYIYSLHVHVLYESAHTVSTGTITMVTCPSLLPAIRLRQMSGRGKDMFRARKQNTSRPPSMHVDDFMAMAPRNLGHRQVRKDTMLSSP